MIHISPIQPDRFKHIVFFTGAGMSAESGVPVYRGSGGVWRQYHWEKYACQEAFDRDPEQVLAFHEKRRQAVLKCSPHKGHTVIRSIETNYANVTVVTQNIDGMHQRAGTHHVIELHGSLWRLRCSEHGVIEDWGETYARKRCELCNRWLRPDIIWFQDSLNPQTLQAGLAAVQSCDLFIGIGTSGVVWPAAGFPQVAKDHNARCIEINPEPSTLSGCYDEIIQLPAGEALPVLFA